MAIGIEAINAYVGQACVDVRSLFEHRGLDLSRFENLMMEQRSVNLPCEDAVTNAVNAAAPLVPAPGPDARDTTDPLTATTQHRTTPSHPTTTPATHVPLHTTHDRPRTSTSRTPP